MTAALDGEFCVFLIGMRINRPLKIHKWLPIAMAMPRMLRELESQKELGLLGSDLWFGRTTISLQYWRSVDHLMNYASNQNREHLPAWKAFTRAVGGSGDVGIWHEPMRSNQGRTKIFIIICRRSASAASVHCSRDRPLPIREAAPGCCHALPIRAQRPLLLATLHDAPEASHQAWDRAMPPRLCP